MVTISEARTRVDKILKELRILYALDFPELSKNDFRYKLSEFTWSMDDLKTTLADCQVCNQEILSRLIQESETLVSFIRDNTHLSFEEFKTEFKKLADSINLDMLSLDKDIVKSRLLIAS